MTAAQAAPDASLGRSDAHGTAPEPRCDSLPLMRAGGQLAIASCAHARAPRGVVLIKPLINSADHAPRAVVAHPPHSAQWGAGATGRPFERCSTGTRHWHARYERPRWLACAA